MLIIIVFHGSSVMDITYTTSEVAKIIGIHPNTVRLYEEIELISKPKRKENGYRVFTQLHIIQFKIARLAFEIEVLQNGLRKQATDIIRACAKCDLDKALELTSDYLTHVEEEKQNAEKAIQIAEQIVSGQNQIAQGLCMTRKQVASYLNITMDTLRNWERNGLFTVKRKSNGYRIYTDEDIRQLIIIKSLRCANYSLAAILRMINTLSTNPNANIKDAIETSQSGDIISACDNLITSLNHAKTNTQKIYSYLIQLKNTNLYNPPVEHQS